MSKPSELDRILRLSAPSLPPRAVAPPHLDPLRTRDVGACPRSSNETRCPCSELAPAMDNDRAGGAGSARGERRGAGGSFVSSSGSPAVPYPPSMTHREHAVPPANGAGGARPPSVWSAASVGLQKERTGQEAAVIELQQQLRSITGAFEEAQKENAVIRREKDWLVQQLDSANAARTALDSARQGLASAAAENQERASQGSAGRGGAEPGRDANLEAEERQGDAARASARERSRERSAGGKDERGGKGGRQRSSSASVKRELEIMQAQLKLTCQEILSLRKTVAMKDAQLLKGGGAQASLGGDDAAARQQAHAEALQRELKFAVQDKEAVSRALQSERERAELLAQRVSDLEARVEPAMRGAVQGQEAELAARAAAAAAAEELLRARLAADELRDELVQVQQHARSTRASVSVDACARGRMRACVM